MNKLAACVLPFLLVATAPCQTEPAGGGGAKEEKSDLRVLVRFDNRSIVRGVALGGCLVERQVRGKFKPSDDPTDRNAGIRLWYYRDMDGFLFVPYRRIAEVKVLGDVSDDDLRVLKRAFRVATDERRARSRAATRRRLDGEDAPPEPTVDLDHPDLTEDERALLRRFPPPTWSASRYGEIQRKRILDDGKLGERESEFADRFDPWKQALDKARKPREETADKDAKKDAETEPTPKPKQLEPVPTEKRGFRGGLGGLRLGGKK